MSHSQTSPRHILAENLSILGFKPTNNTNSHYSGVIVNQDAFSGANNTKAFELMSWFLFNKLDSHKAKKLFAHCWPIVDYRSQPREYRSVAYKWLEELKKENRLVGDIVLRRSYLEDCRGERIEKIMMALSTLVLKTMMERSREYLDEPMIALNSNDSSVRRLMELEEATMKANKIVAKLEARHQQFRLDSENKERTIKQKLERLDSYQTQVERQQRDGTGIPHYILQMTSNSSSSYMEQQMLQRMDTLGSLWEQCADELLVASKSSLKLNEDSSVDFPLDAFSQMWMESWNTVRRIKSEMANEGEIEMDTRLVTWAESQAAYHQRRTIKAKAIISMLEKNQLNGFSHGDTNVHNIYQRKRSLDLGMEENRPCTIQMPSLKRFRSSEHRVQDIRDSVREKVDASYKESNRHGAHEKIKHKPYITGAASELSQLSRIKSPVEALHPPASEAISTKPTIQYDRNGRRIRPAAEGTTYETTQNKTLHAKAPIEHKSGSSGVKSGSTPINERLFKENRGGKSVHTKNEMTNDKPTRSLTPGRSLCDEIVNQVNKPPLSMITPPRSYSPKTISSSVHHNFESPSYSKFREYKRKLSAAVDTSAEELEPTAAATSQASIHMSPILSNTIGHNFDIEDGDSNIFEGFQQFGAQSTPQKPRFMEGGLNRSILSTAAVSPANNSLLAYNAAIDDTSVYLFGEVLPENFDDGVDMTL
ncbi:hypothetical protein K450DRAFT_250154 [Umbelopsis ramanniana AG]|uniref:HAUS augmin-like complex subunit 6 N-terminal domain-containing protein n=1 Tax=Umbelopsis ramanniana AG TaxID=1314678 RepID=A0AAD5E6W9_UMBRA|nr:uncharacterized protein K450DRAFT_250154 [Umbelopsis ramanniana AG]KAI8577819.1 hypothetical protein K450DRAFT_250154 [Umbelopsis ramanniana AG]